jgi:phosphoribosylformylglycinamidine synthase
LGGSEYLKQIHRLIKGDAPDLNLELEKAVQKTTLEAIMKGLVSSAHDCSEGGLVVALAECCVSNREDMIGAVIDRLTFDIRKDALLFGESQSRIILSCKKEYINEIANIARRNNAPFQIIGRTGGKQFKIVAGGRELINLFLEKMAEKWAYSLESLISA